MLPIIKTRNSFPAFTGNFFNDNWLDNFWNEEIDTYQPSVNVTENDKAFNIELVAPGIEKKDFNLNIEDKQLTISYEKKSESEENNDEIKYLRREFSKTSFKKSFMLPENINTDKINASYNNGVLEVTIPKLKEKNNLSRLIKIS